MSGPNTRNVKSKLGNFVPFKAVVGSSEEEVIGVTIQSPEAALGLEMICKLK